MCIRSNEIILPGDSLDLDTDLPDQTVVVEGWLPHQWPDPQLVSISQGRLQVTNTSSQPVVLTNKRVNSVKITSTEDTDRTQPFLSTLKQEIRNVSQLSDSKTIDTIQIGDTTADIRELLQAAHRRYRSLQQRPIRRIQRTLWPSRMSSQQGHSTETRSEKNTYSKL